MRERGIGPDDLDQVPIEHVNIGGEPSDATARKTLQHRILVCYPKRLRASGRDRETVMTEPPSPLTMLFSRHTKRREFITLLGGAAAGLPLAARAQQPGMPVVGFLRSTSLANAAHLVDAFRQGLKETGFVEGQNVAIEYRSAEDQGDRLPVLVGDLVRRHVTLIVGNTPSVLAAKAATTTVPIVFASGDDPVKDGLIASLSRPGGNVTGVSFLSSALAAKRLELLHQIVPIATIIAAMLQNPVSSGIEAERRDLLAAGQAIGQQLIVLDVRSDHEIETAFTNLVRRGAKAVYVGTGAFMNSHRERIVALAARHGLPRSITGAKPLPPAVS